MPNATKLWKPLISGLYLSSKTEARFNINKHDETWNETMAVSNIEEDINDININSFNLDVGASKSLAKKSSVIIENTLTQK